MKRLTMAVAGLLLISCAKEMPMASVTFGYKNIENGTMTKATRVDTIQNIIASKMPQRMALSLISAKTNTIYESEIGGSILIPVGRYTARGLSKGETIAEIAGTACTLSGEPRVMVQEDIAISPNTTTYGLSAQFGCIGIVIDTREVEEVSITSVTLPEMPVPFSIHDHYGIAFINGNLGQRGCRLTIHPKNKDNGDDRKVTLYGIPVSGGIAVEMGRYYVLHPTDVEKVESGFIINTPAMGEVDLK